MTPKPSLLLVDDEPDILFSLTSWLRREFDVHVAAGGAEALEMIQERRPQVLMTDQRMPGMTGVELLSRVRAIDEHIVRIIFTGYADLRAVIDGVNRAGVHRYLTKPWDPDDLLAILQEAAAHYARQAALRILLADLAAHVRQGRALAAGMAAALSSPSCATSAADLAAWQGFAERAAELEQRLSPEAPQGGPVDPV